MIQKYFSIAIILISIIVVSCRQDNELSTQNEDKSLLQKESIEGDLMQRPDSTHAGVNPNDPPKNGTHYKNTSDSLSLDEEITNPPKNGTHYKSK